MLAEEAVRTQDQPTLFVPHRVPIPIHVDCSQGTDEHLTLLHRTVFYCHNVRPLNTFDASYRTIDTTGKHTLVTQREYQSDDTDARVGPLRIPPLHMLSNSRCSTKRPPHHSNITYTTLLITLLFRK